MENEYSVYDTRGKTVSEEETLATKDGVFYLGTVEANSKSEALEKAKTKFSAVSVAVK